MLTTVFGNVMRRGCRSLYDGITLTLYDAPSRQVPC